MKKIFTIIINVFLIVLIFVGCLLLFSILPIKNNIKVLSVISGSMEPTIKTGSVILIKPVSDYSMDEIITFKTPNAKKEDDYTTHRVYKINDNTGSPVYMTKGDANDSPDGQTITKDKIIGKYYGGLPYLGYLISYIKTLPGLLCIIIIPAGIIVVEEVKNIHKEAKKIIKNKKDKKNGDVADEKNL